MVVGELKAQYKRYIDFDDQKALNCSKLVFEFSKQIPELQEDIEYKESVYIFMFNNLQKLVGYSKISEGGLSQSIVDIRIVLQHALLSCATGIILLHNHPTGSLKPSHADLDLTQRVKNALNICDLVLIDHLIISKNNYYSFADEGEI